MKKTMLFLGSLLLTSQMVMAADDTVTATIGMQTFKCSLESELKCDAVTQVQQQTIEIKKDGSSIKFGDKPRELSVIIDTSVENGDMSYDVSLCSKTVCTQSLSNGGADGYINQTMFGQFNLTEKSFYVLGFFITTQNKTVNLKDQIQSKFTLRR